MRPTTLISTGTLLSLLVVLTCGAAWPHGPQPVTEMGQTVRVFLYGPVALRVLAMTRAVAAANAAVQESTPPLGNAALATTLTQRS